MKSSSENRKHPRIEFNWPIEIDLKGRIISAGGVGFLCYEPLPIDEIINFSLVPQDHPPIQFCGKIVWSELYAAGEGNTVYGFGILFAQISQKDSKQYNALIKTLIS